MSYRQLQHDQQKGVTPPTRTRNVNVNKRSKAPNAVAPQQWSPSQRAGQKVGTGAFPVSSTPRKRNNQTH